MFLCWLSVSPCLNLPNTYTQELKTTDPSIRTRGCGVASRIGKFVDCCRCVGKPMKKSPKPILFIQFKNHKCTSEEFACGTDTIQTGGVWGCRGWVGGRATKTANSREKGRNMECNRGRITVCRMGFHSRSHLNELFSNKDLSVSTAVSFAPHIPRL